MDLNNPNFFLNMDLTQIQQHIDEIKRNLKTNNNTSNKNALIGDEYLEKITKNYFPQKNHEQTELNEEEYKPYKKYNQKNNNDINENVEENNNTNNVYYELEKKDRSINNIIIDDDTPSIKESITINSDKAENNCVKLQKIFNNVKMIELVDYSIVPNKNNITESKHNITIKIENIDEEHSINLAEDEYTIEELIGSIQDGFDNIDKNLKIKLTEDNHVMIIHEDDKLIEIKTEKYSINKMLGFTQRHYENKSSYISDEIYNISNPQKIHIYIDELIKNKPFATIDLNSEKKTYIVKQFIPPLNNLSQFTIRFKDINGELLNTSSHNLIFSVVH
jgi:hypothetical protein